MTHVAIYPNKYCRNYKFMMNSKYTISATLQWRSRRYQKMVQIAVCSYVHIQPRLSPTPPPVSFPCRNSKFVTSAPIKTKKTEAGKLGAITASGSLNQTVGGQLLPESESKNKKNTSKKRVFFLDVNPLCYEGSTPSLRSFGHWVSLFFSQVTHTDPVIAVSSLPLSLPQNC